MRRFPRRCWLPCPPPPAPNSRPSPSLPSTLSPNPGSPPAVRPTAPQTQARSAACPDVVPPPAWPQSPARTRPPPAPAPCPESPSAAPSRPEAPASETAAPASATAHSIPEFVRQQPFSPLSSQLHNLAPPRKQHHARHSDEQPMLHHARHVAQLPGQPIRIRNLPKPAIQNVIVLIGHKRIPIGAHSHRHLCPQRRNPFRHQRLREPDHFHRQRKLPQHRHLLRSIRHNHKLPGRRRHNLLPQQRPAAALD